MVWTINRSLQFIKNSIQLALTRDIFNLIRKNLEKDDGSYFPFKSIDLPLGLFKKQEFIFVACPQISREILLQDASLKAPTSHFNRGWIGDIFYNALGDTLFTVEFSKHKHLRQFVSSFFRQSLDVRFGENLCHRTHALIDAWTAKKSVNVNHDLPFFTSQAIIDNFIGKIENSMELHDAMETILRNMERQFLLKKSFSDKKMQAARKVVNDVAAKAALDNSENSSLISLMAQAKNEASEPLFSSEDIEAMARFLFLAGQETVASILPALIYHCTSEYQQKIREEWKKESLNMDSSEDIMHFCKKSKWVQAIINESLRLFPPAYSMVRMSNQDVMIQGMHIPKNAMAVLYIFFFQRDPTFWGQDAALFKPERWFSLPKDESLPFMPFGIGPSHCLGQPFARLEMGIFLTLLALKTEWKALNKSYIPYPKFSLSSREDVLISVKRQ